jgi:CubicO group peptidase (beta-lactamase class C family)
LSADSELCIEKEFREAISRGLFSGASLLISGGRGPDFERTRGIVESGGVPVSLTTRFDLASLTKPLVTAPLCMIAIGRGSFNLNDRLSRFFPGLVPGDKEEITVRNLLSHSSGLPAYRPFYTELVKLPVEARRTALSSMILKTSLESLPGRRVQYSDLGFMLLGLIIEKQMGGMLDRLAKDFLFDPLEIDELHFCPMNDKSPVAGHQPSVLNFKLPAYTYAATQFCPWRKRLLRGEVDDENAWTLNGVAGHAGLFGTARGVFKLLSFLWNIYEGNVSNRLWPEETVRLFWTRTHVDEGPSEWCLGYDTPSRKGISNAGRFFSRNTVGHLGFTGVSFWLDLEKRVLVILLTNRVHTTRRKDALRQLRPVLHDCLMEGLVTEEGRRITEDRTEGGAQI